jgi:hypothetical protein
MQSFRKYASLIASLLVAAFGATGLISGERLLGVALLVLGLLAAAWQGRALYGAREDPYDLRKLMDQPEIADEPEDDFGDEDSAPFCHNCGHAVARPFSRCPDCGNPVR